MNNFNFVNTAVQAAVSINNINDEVDSLLDQSRNDIGRFEATTEWLALNLKDLPEVHSGTVTIQFTDSRGFNIVKHQSLSESLWVVAMQQIQYHLSVNYDLLSTAFANWVSENVYREHDDLGRKTYSKVECTPAQMVELAKQYLVSMQELDIIGNNIVKKVIRLQAGNNITTKVYEITTNFSEVINNLIETLRERASMKCRPLANQPMDWTDGKTGIGENANIRLIKGSKVKSNKISSQVLKAVNKLQHVKFVVSPVMLEAAKDMLLNRSLFTTTHSEFFAVKELNNEAFDLYAELAQYAGKEFYFPVTLDTRGRMYYRGGMLSPQGVDFCKAAFQFAEAKPLGATGLRGLMIHTANVCGKDKLSIQERVEWVTRNWMMLGDIKSHRDIRKLLPNADVFQALVACGAIDKIQHWVANCEEIELYPSNLVCHQDGTCNGLQHMAAITGDRKTAEAVNCVESSGIQAPSDVYGTVANKAAELTTGVIHDLITKYNRSMAKNPVMVTSYGATESTIINNIAKYITTKGEDISNAEAIGKSYLAAINETAGAVTQLTEALSTRVAYAVEDGQERFVWRTADGFLASTKYVDEEAMSIRVGLFYTRKHGLGKAPLDARKTAQAMAPNFIHSIDATHLRMVVNECDHELVTVHDSIGSHACDFADTSRVIRETFVKVHSEYDALSDLCENMKQPVPEFPRIGDYKVEEALKSSYLFS